MCRRMDHVQPSWSSDDLLDGDGAGDAVTTLLAAASTFDHDDRACAIAALERAVAEVTVTPIGARSRIARIASMKALVVAATVVATTSVAAAAGLLPEPLQEPLDRLVGRDAASTAEPEHRVGPPETAPPAWTPAADRAGSHVVDAPVGPAAHDEQPSGIGTEVREQRRPASVGDRTEQAPTRSDAPQQPDRAQPQAPAEPPRRPEGAGQPEGAGRPDEPGQPADPGPPVGAGQPQGTPAADPAAPADDRADTQPTTGKGTT